MSSKPTSAQTAKGAAQSASNATCPDVLDTAGPIHVGIIMDGNGRWAKARGLPRAAGHHKGVEAVRRVVRHAARQGLKYLTVFSFSSENWSRPVEEVDHLLGLLRAFIRDDLADLHASNIRVRVIGKRDNLSDDLRAMILDTERLTASNTGLQLIVAFNYGARDELVRAAKRIAQDVEKGELKPEEIDESALTRALDTGDVPDPDLIIRTSGEQRLSNFLLWQAAYAEFAFVPEYWPEFDENVFDRVVGQFRSRDRRFGGL